MVEILTETSVPLDCFVTTDCFWYSLPFDERLRNCRNDSLHEDKRKYRISTVRHLY